MKRIPLRLFIILSPILLVAAVEARAADELRSAMRARNPREMRQSVKEMREIPRLQALCRAQLHKKFVPTACFESLVLQSRAPETWLIDNCVSAVPLIGDLSTLQRLSRAPALPDSCRNDLRKRYEDLRYAAETEAPATLIDIDKVR